MEKVQILNGKSVQSKIFYAMVGIALAIVLPQIFHLVGKISGAGKASGALFCPMHFGVIIAGLLSGPAAGLFCGAISPLLSHAISGMPGAADLPFMMAELAAYGLVSGIFADKKIPLAAKVLIAMVAGRILRSLAIVVCIKLFGANMPMKRAYAYIIVGLPGILLQLTFIPLLVDKILSVTRNNE